MRVLFFLFTFFLHINYIDMNQEYRVSYKEGEKKMLYEERLAVAILAQAVEDVSSYRKYGIYV